MPQQAAIFGGKAFEDQQVALMARLKGNSAANVTQVSITSATYVVTEKDTGTVVVASTALTIASVIFDTLQTDARWTLDTTGYNFRFDAPATSFPDGSKTYRVEIIFIPSSGGAASQFPLVYEISTEDLRRS